MKLCYIHLVIDICLECHLFLLNLIRIIPQLSHFEPLKQGISGVWIILPNPESLWFKTPLCGQNWLSLSHMDWGNSSQRIGNTKECLGVIRLWLARNTHFFRFLQIPVNTRCHLCTIIITLLLITFIGSEPHYLIP